MPKPGATISGTYRLEKLLGKGGMGEVWLAQHLLLNEPRAIKLMLGAFTADENLRDRFIQGEARNALRLAQHPNLVRTYELGLYEDSPYIVMEYVAGGPDGTNLLELLKSRGSLNVVETGAILAQIAAALEVAHQQHIIHRDIKPANILVAGEGLYKLTDFGLTKDLDDGVALTVSGFSMGSLHYMSPEQAEGQAERRSDLYSLGIVLYEALVGRPPFSGSPAKLMFDHSTKPPTPLKQLAPEVPAEVEAVVLKALAKQPAERYSSVTELAEAYARALREWGQRQTSATTAVEITLEAPTELLLSTPPALIASARASQIVTQPPADPPTVKTAESFNNLPVQLTSFVGREREIAQARLLLQNTHLLTLTGAGGTGKTRLSLQLAGELLDSFKEGVWLIELAPVSDPALITQTVAAVLSLRDEPGRPLQTTLTEYLRNKKMLLVLDNCEHLVATAAKLAETLLRNCPGLKILASSRENLAIGGETTWRVPSLSLPDPQHLPDLEGLTQYEAVKLFIDRATSAQPNFIVTNENAPALAQLCYRLDGIPLALELAAARVKMLSVEQITTRLDQRFRLLTSGSRTALPRQQTLKALIDWSYDLLGEEERRLLHRLSVFAGGWTLVAAEAVCAGEGLEDFEVMDFLAQLVNKSLVVMDETESADPRYRLLQSIRQYAQDKLIESGEAETCQQNHATYYLTLAEEAAPHLTGANQLEWLSRLELEHDNLRAALLWGSQKSEVKSQKLEIASSLSLRLAAALWRFWQVRGYYSEGRRWLETALAQPSPLELRAARAKALTGAGVLAQLLGDYSAAMTHYEESLNLGRELDDRQGIATALHNLGNLAFLRGDYHQARHLFEQGLAERRDLKDKNGMAVSLGSLASVARLQGDYAGAISLHEESLKLRRELKDVGGIATSLTNLGNLAYLQQDYPKATALYEESLRVWRESGNKNGSAISLNNLGNVARLQGQFELAKALLQESLKLRHEISDKSGIASSLNNLGSVACSQGEYARAHELQIESLKLRQELGDKRGIVECLEGLATIAGAQGQAEQVARLGGIIEVLHETLQLSLIPAERTEYEQAIAAVRAQMEETIFTNIWNEGRDLSLESALDSVFKQAYSVM